MSHKDWKVGDRIVCVNVTHDTSPTKIIRVVGGLDGLKKGRVYTIRDFVPCMYRSDVCVRLDEIVRCAKGSDVYEPGFLVSRFRRVEPRKTNIGIFTAMLNKTGVNA